MKGGGIRLHLPLRRKFETKGFFEKYYLFKIELIQIDLSKINLFEIHHFANSRSIKFDLIVKACLMSENMRMVGIDFFLIFFFL